MNSPQSLRNGQCRWNWLHECRMQWPTEVAEWIAVQIRCSHHECRGGVIHFRDALLLDAWNKARGAEKQRAGNIPVRLQVLIREHMSQVEGSFSTNRNDLDESFISEGFFSKKNLCYLQWYCYDICNNSQIEIKIDYREKEWKFLFTVINSAEEQRLNQPGGQKIKVLMWPMFEIDPKNNILWSDRADDRSPN